MKVCELKAETQSRQCRVVTPIEGGFVGKILTYQGKTPISILTLDCHNGIELPVGLLDNIGVAIGSDRHVIAIKRI